MQIHEGTECVTTSYGKVRGLAKSYPYFQPATYIASRLASGELVWRYTGHIGTARRSHRLAERDTALYAAQHGLMMIGSVRQWCRIKEEVTNA